jgi:hypothetical protein
VVAATVAAMAFASLAIAVRLHQAQAKVGVPIVTYVADYNDHPARDALEVVVVEGDGQSFAAIARDPAMRRPGVFLPDPDVAAYRFQRPLWGYLAWLATLGRPDAIHRALLVLSVLAAGFAAAATAILIGRRGGDPLLGAFVAITPGALAAYRQLTPELFAAGLAVAGIAAWTGSTRRTAAASVLFAAAALGRETMLVVPLVLACTTRDRRGWVACTAPFAVVAGWFAVVRLRLDAWPWAAAGGRVTAPFVGLVRSLDRWETPLGNTLAYGITVVVVIALIAWRRDDLTAWLAIGFAGVGACMGVALWTRWDGVGRVLVPLYTFAVVALAPRRLVAEPATAATATSATVRGAMARDATPPSDHSS